MASVNKEKQDLYEYVKKLLSATKTSTVDHDYLDTFFCKNMDLLKHMLSESEELDKNDVGLPKSTGIKESIIMRERLIDWLRQVNNYRNSKPGVLAVTVAIIDNYVYSLSLKKSSFCVSGDNYQYVGAAAYHLASKLEEVTPILTSDLTRFTKDSCKINDIEDLEFMISAELNFESRFITPIDIIELLVTFLRSYVPNQSDIMELERCSCDTYMRVIEKYSIKKFPTHVVAICSIIIGYYELEFYTSSDQDKITAYLMGLCSIKKEDIYACYEHYMNLINLLDSEDNSTGACSSNSYNGNMLSTTTNTSSATHSGINNNGVINTNKETTSNVEANSFNSRKPSLVSVSHQNR